MESRRRLYKATGNPLTLTERVRKDQTRQNVTRNNRFNANRQIDINLDDSLSTPTKPAPVKISQIKDKNEKLKAYIEQKRTKQLKQQFEQRSPFIPYVPVGRWVEKREPVRKPKAFTISTPIRKALMSDGKILKKSTLKQIATTAKKENLGANKATKQNEPVKSRKKILTEFNSFPVENKLVEKQKDISDKNESPEKLNETFELLSSVEENVTEKITEEIKTPEKSSFVLEPLLMDDEIIAENIKVTSPVIVVPEKSVEKEQPVPVKEPVIEKKTLRQKKETAIIAVPVKRPVREKIVNRKVTEKVLPKKEEKKKKTVTKSKSATQKKSPVLIEESSKKTQDVVPGKVQKKAASYLYQFYRKAIENQEKYISIKLKAFTSNMDSFIDKLSADMQSSVHQTVQQGKLLVNEKLKSFDDILEKYESASETGVKRITEDDLENYWMLLYSQIEKFNENLQLAQEAKTIAMCDGKRKTRKTLTDTPSRKSRRIAESNGTPKHNSSTCFACTPMSASRVNTPKSAKKRRATLKKSLAFDANNEN